MEPIFDKIANEFIEKIQKIGLTNEELAMFIMLGQKPVQNALTLLNGLLGHEKATKILELYVEANKEIAALAKDN